MSTTTTRLGILKPSVGDAFVPHTDIGNVADALDQAAMYEQGALGSIPAGTAKPNGYWYADTATGGHVYVNVGTGGARAYREIPTVSNGKQLISGPSFASYQLSDTGATSGLRRAHLSTDGGTTVLQSTNDAGDTELERGFEFDHATGGMDFPNGVTVEGAAFADVLGAYRKLIQIGMPVTEAADASVNVFNPGAAALGSVLVGGSFYFNPADYAIAGKTANLRVTLDWLSNAVSPAMSATASLRRITAVAGAAANSPAPTLAAPSLTTASTGALGANAMAHAVSSALDASTLTAGHYVLVLNPSGAVANNATASAAASLELRYA